jgi:hypothetical protein
MLYNSLDGWRQVGCQDSRTLTDWAEEVRQLLEADYSVAKTPTLARDSLNTHDFAIDLNEGLAGSLLEAVFRIRMVTCDPFWSERGRTTLFHPIFQPHRQGRQERHL